MPVTTIGGPGRVGRAYPGHRWHHAMTRILVAGRAAGVRVIDGPYADFRDLDGFRRSCAVARALGYDGKWCIHPAQIPIANEVFSPTVEEIDWATRVVEAYRCGHGRGHRRNRGRRPDDRRRERADGASERWRQSTTVSPEKINPARWQTGRGYVVRSHDNDV